MIDTETCSVVIEREFAHAPEKLWRALTQPHLIGEWLMKNDFQPVVGHKFILDPKPVWNGQIDCEVRVVEQNRRLSYSWDSMGVNTVVTWTLTPTKVGVLLRMEQTGFRPDQAQASQGAKFGWQNFFGRLEKVLDKI
jgi:uncharacterized protein YndB with AHSA1/START domain